MESFRHQRSPGANTFLGLFSQPPPPDGGASAAAASAGDELDEDDIFYTETDSSDPNHPSPKHPSSFMASPNPNPNPSSSLFRPGLRRFPDRNFGILAALPEEDKKRPLLQRKAFSPSSSSAAASTAASPSSPSSSARMIPIIPKPKPDYAISVPAGGKIYQQSAPVNVPIVPPRNRRGWEEPDRDLWGSEDVEEEEMLPPHEIVARAAVSKESPLTTFSMLEGVGRTLKGRDLRRVRNAVWRQTGFLD